MGAVEVLTPHPVSAPELPTALRPVSALELPGIEPGVSCDVPPIFEWIDPAELLVDEAYQRHLSESSVTLIRKIVAQWDWRRFKPPVVARTEAGPLVVDGQHTAIAAATHPEISRIPIMVVAAEERAAQARAFVGHNRDRLNITSMQMHFAALAAGDEDALTLDQVCQRAGVTVLRVKRPGSAFRPRETLAVSAIAALIGRRGPQKARIILQVLAEAEAAPVLAGQIKAVEMLLHDPEYQGQVDPPAITAALQALTIDAAEREAKIFAAAHNVQIWRALGIVVFRKARKRRP